MATETTNTRTREGIEVSLRYGGPTAYPVDVSEETVKAFEAFLAAARRDAEKGSGGHHLDADPIVNVHIAGNGWVTTVTREGRN